MTAKETLKKYNITPETRHHDYTYLYASIMVAMNDYATLRVKQEITKSKIKLLERCLIDDEETREHNLTAWDLYKLDKEYKTLKDG